MTAASERPTAPVSVVVPCYRCSATIERALASVAGQTVLPVEVILVDDGSEDGTRELLIDLAARHPAGWVHVVILRQNQGAASARNAGWEAATQPYVAFLDADDAWHPRKIELQYAFMATHPEVALSGHRQGAPRLPAFNEGGTAPLEGRHLSRLGLLLSNPLVTPSVMLKRSIPLRFRPGRRHVDDHLLWLQIQTAGFPVVELSTSLTEVFKPMFGAGGLSGELWKMEKAELANYWILRDERCIGLPTVLALSGYSLAKYLRRVLLSSLRRA